MYGAGSYKRKKKWRQGLKWHIKQFYFSYKVWRKTAQDKHYDLLTFHCWRVYMIFRDRNKEIYE